MIWKQNKGYGDKKKRTGENTGPLFLGVACGGVKKRQTASAAAQYSAELPEARQ